MPHQLPWRALTRARSTICRTVACAVLVPAALAATGGAPAYAQHADPSGGCGQPQAANHFLAQFPVDNLQRTALVDIPAAAAKGKPLPLLLMFGGAGSDAFRTEASAGFTQLAARYGFIMVYPNEVAKYWNLTGGGAKGNDDVEFVASLLEQLDNVLCVDDSHVYAAGVSNGGGFVSRLSCELNPRLAGIASVAGLYGREPACEPKHPLSVLEMHGTNDQTVPYNGSPTQAIQSVWWFLKRWSAWDSCPDGPWSWQRLASGALLQAKSGCQDGTSIAHVRLRGEPHAWPTMAAYVKGGRSAGIPFDAATAVMQFFTSGTIRPQALPAAAKHRH